jgi:cysteine desulfurase
MSQRYSFFDNAATTRCCDSAAALVHKFGTEAFGNPSSSHALGQQASKAIREARLFFADQFRVDPEQVIFTGSGSEADNLAIYGIAMDAFVKRKGAPIRVVTSAIEHAAVRKTAQSLAAFGIDAQSAPVNEQGQVDGARFLELLTPDTVLASIMQVSNIVGSILPVEELARQAKAKVPDLVFHADCVQSFGKVELPKHPSAVDLVSISAHKIHGPKGVGALIVLNKKLLKQGLRPLIWGGEQEGGFRSGTQNAGLIAGFHAAAVETVAGQAAAHARVTELRASFRGKLLARGLLAASGSAPGPLRWNSPNEACVPHVINLSAPGYPPSSLAKLLEERGCLVSTGSACSSAKMEPDYVLAAMGLPATVHSSAIRVSFSAENSEEEIEQLARSLDEALDVMAKLLGGPSAGRK